MKNYDIGKLGQLVHISFLTLERGERPFVTIAVFPYRALFSCFHMKNGKHKIDRKQVHQFHQQNARL